MFSVSFFWGVHPTWRIQHKKNVQECVHWSENGSDQSQQQVQLLKPGVGPYYLLCVCCTVYKQRWSFSGRRTLEQLESARFNENLTSTINQGNWKKTLNGYVTRCTWFKGLEWKCDYSSVSVISSIILVMRNIPLPAGLHFDPSGAPSLSIQWGVCVFIFTL